MQKGVETLDELKNPQSINNQKVEIQINFGKNYPIWQ